jgi:glycolate oxidase iron-sulfur subunit
MARAEAERSRVLDSPPRRLLRDFTLGFLFGEQSRLRLAGRLLWLYQASGLQGAIRRSGLLNLLPKSLRDLEAKTPAIQCYFSPDLIAPVETAPAAKHRVALLTGCVQDIAYSDVNRDTADVLLANGCSVLTPPGQGCCGSLHAHNGDYEQAKDYARRLLDQFDPASVDAIITNAAGCGSHLKHYDRLLEDDPDYAAKAVLWSEKVKDISEWLMEIGVRPPEKVPATRVTYHDACHLCHGQKITAQPRALLAAIPGLEVVPLTESMWCCGSAGIYNLIQPEMAAKLQDRKLDHVAETGAQIVAAGNPGCLLQIKNGLAARGQPVETVHPVTLLARAYRRKN